MVRTLQGVRTISFPLVHAILTSFRLAPKYEELGEMYQSNPDFAKKVTIAKVDATANDVPEEIQGFPTIKLYPAGGKGVAVDYSGDRSIEDLANFVRDHGKYKIDANAAANDSAKDGEPAGSAAAAASQKKHVTDKAKSVVSEAAEAVKTAIKDTDDGDHDEL